MTPDPQGPTRDPPPPTAKADHRGQTPKAKGPLGTTQPGWPSDDPTLILFRKTGKVCVWFSVDSGSRCFPAGSKSCFRFKVLGNPGHDLFFWGLSLLGLGLGSGRVGFGALVGGLTRRWSSRVAGGHAVPNDPPRLHPGGPTPESGQAGSWCAPVRCGPSESGP